MKKILFILFALFALSANAQIGLLKPGYIGWPNDSTANAVLGWNTSTYKCEWLALTGGGDSLVITNDSICVIYLGDTLCVGANQQDSFYLSGDTSLCVIHLGDTLCSPYSSAGTTLYTGNGSFPSFAARVLDMNQGSFKIERRSGYYAGSGNIRFLQSGLYPIMQITSGVVGNSYSSSLEFVPAFSAEDDLFVDFNGPTAAEDYSFGVARSASLNPFTIAEGIDLGASAGSPMMEFYGVGDSIVAKKDFKVWAGLRDRQGDLGSSGQVLSSTGATTNWITPTDLNGFFTSSNSGGTIASNFDAIVTDSLQLRGNNGINKNIYFSLHAPAANGNANLFLTNSTSGSDNNDGLLIQFSGSEQANIMNRCPNGALTFGCDNVQRLVMFSSQSGATYEPSVTSFSTFVAEKGIHNHANEEITVQDTLNKIQANINITGGVAGDTIFLPEIYSAGGGTGLESCNVLQTNPGQEYTISNFRGGGTALVVSVMNITGTDDVINGGSAVTIPDGKSAIIRAVTINSGSGVGYWFSWTSD